MQFGEGRRKVETPFVCLFKIVVFFTLFSIFAIYLFIFYLGLFLCLEVGNGDSCSLVLLFFFGQVQFVVFNFSIFYCKY